MALKEVMDAVATALSALTELPEKKHVFKYHRPLNLVGPTGVFTPTLSVAFKGDKASLADTNTGYEFCHELLITWYHGQVESSVRAGIDESKAAEALDVYEALRSEIITWHPGGVPGITAYQTEAVLRNSISGKVEGGIMAFEFEVDVATWNL